MHIRFENCYTSGTVTGNNYVGGLVGHNWNGNYFLQLNYCHSSCTVSGYSGVGGLTGGNEAASINHCYSTGNVSGNGIHSGFAYGVGGLIGYNSSSTVYNSYSTGNVSGTDNTGGFIGYTDNSTINNCFSRGNVSILSGASAAIGGFAGNNLSTTIQNCYTTANIIGSSFITIGFVGSNSSGTFTNNFWDDELSSQTSAIGATAKTTAEMKTQTTFTNAGWDFLNETTNGTNDYWGITALQNDGYPYIVAPVEITATSGDAGPTGYGTLKAAFDAINLGTHKGAITIKITGNITETATAVLYASASGSASYTSINMYPTVTGLSISGNLAAPLIDLNGADNVTINGSVGGTGSTKDLIISNLNYSTTLGTSTIRFIYAASNNTVKNCTIKGSSLSATTNFSTGGGILLFSTTTTTGNNNNLIDNNNITNAGGNRPKTALYSYGTTGATNDGNTISNNMFYDFFNPNMSSAGIYLNSNTSAWNITGNTFYETTALAPTTLATYYGIRAYGSSTLTRGSGFTISDNFIGGNAADHTGTLTISSAQNHGLIGIDLWVGTTTTSSIQNNTIKNIDYTTTAQTPFYGINIHSGNVNIGTLNGNTIGSTTGNGSISLTSSTNFTISEGITNGGSGTVNIQNNKIGGINIIGSADAGHSFYGIDASAGSSTISNNTIGSTDAGTTNSIWASSSTTGTQNIYGIYSNGATSVNISRNMVSQLTNAATGGVGEVTGIKLSSSTLTNNITNNIIILGGDTKTTIYGIYETGSSSSNSNLYFNTVYIAGTVASGTIKSYALYSDVNATTRNFRNNIFCNARTTTSGTSLHYALYIVAGGGLLTCDYNDYLTSSAGSGGMLGYYGGDKSTSVIVTGQDVHSLNSNPLFVSAGGTTAANYLPTETSLLALTGTGITTDYTGAVTRSVTYPAMGAWEYTIICNVPSISNQSTAGNTQCLNGTYTPITVSATGTGLSYQWFYNTSNNNTTGTTLNSANGGNTYSYTPQSGTSGTLYYYCVVTGTCGTATSAVSGALVTNPSRRYVSTAGAGALDGSSWSNAYSQTQLQTAINQSCVTEVWVAAGTYYPVNQYGGVGLRFQAFQMKNGVAIYGGFAGTETDINQRTDFGAGGVNESILSGDIGTADSQTDNCYHVFYHPSAFGLTNTAILNGFSIKWGSTITTDGAFGNNKDEYRGGGMYNGSNNSPYIQQCTFSNNKGGLGGGIYNFGPSNTTMMENCTFNNNYSYEWGGGIYNTQTANVTIINCLICNNTAVATGGGGSTIIQQMLPMRAMLP